MGGGGSSATLKLQAPARVAIERFKAQVNAAEARGRLDDAQGLPARQLEITYSCQQAQVAAVFQRQHVAQVKHALRARPIVGHVADIGGRQTSVKGCSSRQQ